MKIVVKNCILSLKKIDKSIILVDNATYGNIRSEIYVEICPKDNTEVKVTLLECNGTLPTNCDIEMRKSRTDATDSVTIYSGSSMDLNMEKTATGNSNLNVMKMWLNVPNGTEYKFKIEQVPRN